MSTFVKTFLNPSSKPKDFELKTSVIGVISKGYVSRRIQEYSDCREVSLEQRWSHVAALIQHPELLEWVVIESHFDTGCTQYNLDTWLSRNKSKKIYQMPYHYLNDQLIVYPREKIKYGTKGIIRLKLHADFKVATGNDDPAGVFCSELLAKCDSLNISKYFKEHSFLIKPVDFQRLGVMQGFGIAQIQ